MKKALVLGCGLIGKTVALDLAEDFSVTVMDPFEKALASLADRNDIKKIQKPADDAAEPKVEAESKETKPEAKKPAAKKSAAKKTAAKKPAAKKTAAKKPAAKKTTKPKKEA